MKTFRQILSAALAAAMLTAALPAFGAGNDVSAEEAITIARTVVNIPDELSEFQYDIYESGYYLGWHSSDYNKSATVVVNKKGVIVGYSCYDGTSSRGLSTLRKEELWQTARSFLDQVIPDLSAKLVLSEEDSNGRRAVFYRYENGARVEGNSATVYVNKMNGKVEDYDLSWDFEHSFSGESRYPDEFYFNSLKEGAAKLEYNTFWPETYDADKEPKPYAFPVIRILNNIRVNAMNNTVFEGRSYMGGDVMYSMADDAAAEMTNGVARDSGAGGAAYKLSPQEQAAVDSMEKLITAEYAKEKINSLTELWMPVDYELTMNYTTNRYGDKTTYTASATCTFADDNGNEGYARITMDGETGEVKGVYINRDDLYETPENPVSDDDCKNTAAGFLGKVKSLDGYRENGERTYQNKRNYTLNYVKYIGNIPYPDDSKSVTVSKKSGKVTSFYESISKAEIITPASYASDAVERNYSLEKVYSYDSENNPVLSYALKPNGSFYRIKAEDGTPIDYSGKLTSAKSAKSDETGHWAWEVFDLLRENDIYIQGDYSLDDAIRTEDFNDLVRMAINISDMPYRYYYYEEPPVSEADIAKNADTVSREAAAEYIMKALGWEKLINLNVFTTKFADEADFASGIGGAAVLQGLGILQGSDGYFNPRRNLTYGEAYTIAYKLALMDKEKDDKGIMPLE